LCRASMWSSSGEYRYLQAYFELQREILHVMIGNIGSESPFRRLVTVQEHRDERGVRVFEYRASVRRHIEPS
jgi:hypothetical protein